MVANNDNAGLVLELTKLIASYHFITEQQLGDAADNAKSEIAEPMWDLLVCRCAAKGHVPHLFIRKEYAHWAPFARSQIFSMTSSMYRSVESITTASSAATSGATSRDES